MSRIRAVFTSKFMFIPPVVLGLAVLVMVVNSSKEPQRREVVEAKMPVRTVPVIKREMRPRSVGYGVVQPGRVWRGVAQVGGKVTELNPAFEVGALLAKDEILIRIEPLEFEIAVTSAQARIKGVEAQLKELELEQENLRLSLDLEKQNLNLLERDFRRNLALVSEGSISEAVMEQTQREVLRQRLQVQGLANNLTVLPAREEQLEATLQQNIAQLEDARRRLGQTVIRMPYEGRISTKSVELGQAVSPGAVVAEVDGVAVAEIEVGLTLNKMNALMSGVRIMEGQMPTPEVFENMGLGALVRLNAVGESAVWEARFSRVNASLDSGARTVGVIVSVGDPYRKAKPGIRPPLVKGMLCEVEVRGPSREALVIPRSALHENNVYVVGQDGRLEIRKVVSGAVQKGFAEITHGLEPHEIVVVSDLAPAVDGMLLEALRDDAVLAQLERETAGKGGDQ